MNPTTKRYYVYAHYTKDTKELFYIGKGTGHRAYCKNSRNKHWKNIVKKHEFLVCFYDVNLEENDAYSLEFNYIKNLKPKANKMPGGRISFFNNVLIRDKKSEKIRGLAISKGLTGKKHSEERKLAASVRNKGKKWRLNEYRHSNKTKKKIGIKSVGRKHNYKKITCLENGIVFNSIVEAANWCNGYISKIRSCCQGRIKKHKNYSWGYL